VYLIEVEDEVQLANILEAAVEGLDKDLQGISSQLQRETRCIFGETVC